MLSLREYRNKAERLADFLPWAALIGPGVRSSRRQCADLRRTILHAIFPILLLRWSSANARPSLPKKARISKAAIF